MIITVLLFEDEGVAAGGIGATFVLNDSEPLAVEEPTAFVAFT